MQIWYPDWVRRVCVFCGSAAGVRLDYAEAAMAMGTALAERGVGLVYGGGHVGLMGVVADAALAGGSEVIGVIPKGLHAREVGHEGISELRVVETMHERKAEMAALADGFVTLPGGLGTLEELFEVWTWAQLGIHRKPLALLDVGGYWQPLIALVEAMAAEGFVAPVHRRMLLVESDPEDLLDRMQTYEPPPTIEWLAEGET
jgi:uncharacterized protein (TIGR00730 family)